MEKIEKKLWYDKMWSSMLLFHCVKEVLQSPEILESVKKYYEKVTLETFPVENVPPLVSAENFLMFPYMLLVRLHGILEKYSWNEKDRKKFWEYFSKELDIKSFSGIEKKYEIEIKKKVLISQRRISIFYFGF